MGGWRERVGGMTGGVGGMTKGKEGNAPFVIPVDTGIQRGWAAVDSRLRGNDGWGDGGCGEGRRGLRWIPAYAGMTDGGMRE